MKVMIAGLAAIISRESATIAAIMVGAVEQVGQEMDAMVLLGDRPIINVYLNQVCLNVFSRKSKFTLFSIDLKVSNE
jgi:hypothetical protein